MPRFADLTIMIADNPTSIAGASVNYLIEANNGDLYFVYSSGSHVDVCFIKSTNGGLSWSQPTLIFTGTATAVAVWYDRWSGIAAGLIHIAYTESATDDTLYRTINTESADALSTQTTIFAGTSTAGAGMLAISRARGGNVYCRTMIDAGAEGEFRRLANANVPNGAWDAARTINEANATQDQMLLLPGFAADNQDMIAIFWDASADEISRQLYDDSANSWAETSISTGMVDSVATTAFPHFAAAVDLTNSRIILVAWNGVDTANADLLGWTVTESAITAFTTPVVSNGTDDQGLCGISLDTVSTKWTVYYAGKSDGSETWNTSLNVYFKQSTDSGATWGPETLISSAARGNMIQMCCCPRITSGRWIGPLVNTETSGHAGTVRYSAQIAQPGARHQLGM